MESALLAADELIQAEPSTAPVLFDSLRRPFSLWRLQALRYSTLLTAARVIGASALTDVFEELEPYPLWRADLLELRLNAYQATGSPYLPVAEEDWLDFQRGAGSIPGKTFF